MQPRFIIRHAATGESMPPDSRHATRPAVPIGQPARPGHLAEVVERLARQHLDANHQRRRCRDSTRPAARLLDRPPISRSTWATASETACRRGATETRKLRHVERQGRRGSLAIAPIARRGRAASPVARRREVREAERPARVARRPGRSRRSGPRTISTRPIGVRTARTSRSDSAAQIAHEPVKEPRAVLALERDLL